MDPLAEALADEMRDMAGSRKRLLASECDTALIEIAPWLRWDPGRRRRLADLLDQLIGAGEITPSTSQDMTVRPALPRFVSFTGIVAEPAERAGENYPWRPELEWAHELRLSGDEFEALSAIQAFLRDHPTPARVAHRERSLELFGHEKRLDRLVRGRLFDNDRLSLELLGCWWAAPPIAWKPLRGDGPVIVSENAAGYHAIAAAYAGTTAAVAYGAGGAFAQSVASLTDIGPVGDIAYIGDLDAEGLAIPQRAAPAAAAAGLPEPRPDFTQWEALADAATRYGQIADPVPAEVAVEMCQWFGDRPVGEAVRLLLEQGVRVPQEALTAEVLRHLEGDHS